MFVCSMFMLRFIPEKGQESTQVTESTVNPASLDTETKSDDDDDSAFPTLYVAVVFGLEDVVRSTIQNDTDVNVNFNDKNGWIPLHTAAAFGALVNENSICDNKMNISNILLRSR